MTNHAAFQSWLDAFGSAWETLDPDALAALFSEEAEYHVDPFQAPKRGREAIRAELANAWSRQRDVGFRARMVAVNGAVGWAEWSSGFTRVGTEYPVRLEGVLAAEFDGEGKCSRLRQWWHVFDLEKSEEIRAMDA